MPCFFAAAVTPSFAASSSTTAFCDGVYTFATRDRGVRLTGGNGAGDVPPALSLACTVSLRSIGDGALSGIGFAADDALALSVPGTAASLGVTGLSGAGFAAAADSLTARLTPAIEAHRLTQLCATSCFFAAPLTPIVRTSASTASRCSAV